MSIDLMTGLTFIFLALTVIFVLFRKHKLSTVFSLLSLIMYVAANKTYLYLALLSIGEIFKK